MEEQVSEVEREVIIMNRVFWFSESSAEVELASFKWVQFLAFL